MSSNAPYHETDAQLGGSAGLYGNQNGGTPPGPTDPELQLQESLGQLRGASDMMHAGAPQGQQMGGLNAHHQFQTPPRPTHSPQQMAQSVMSLEDHGMYGDHDSASRKRSKVSRACDECRRKKIRCDATSENGPEACSSCKRTGARCQFSRQPMKRGPSKGYIKELADRLNSLENQIQNPHAPGQTFDYSSVADHGMGDVQAQSPFARKRTHSMSEGLQDAFTRQGWSGQDRGTYDSDMSQLAMLTHQDLAMNGQHARRPSYSELTLAGNLITGLNDGAIKAYYNIIHPTLPILPHDSTALSRLTNAPPKLREAFFMALECSVRSVSPTALPPHDMSLSALVQQCSESLETAQHALGDVDSLRQLSNNLVYCQLLAFLIIASDKPGSNAAGNTAELLGRLAGRISELDLNDAKLVPSLREQQRENFEDSRRIFWVAVVLDRLHASSRTKDTILPLHCGSVSRDDFNALGETGYHLARAADTVGQVAYVTRASNITNLDTSSPFAFEALTKTSPTSLYLNGQITRLRESLDISTLSSNSPPQLTYQYLRLLVARLAQSSSREVLMLTKELLSNLISTPISPLHHIFASLVATSLTELSDRLETQVDAHASIKEMDDAISDGHITHRVPNGSGWDTAIRNLLHQKQPPTSLGTSAEQTSPAPQPNMAGLQHLAAAAVGEREGADARPASSNGGNNALPQPSSEAKHDVTAAIAAANEAIAAQATAAAAQTQLQNALGNANGGGSYDPSALVKEGFMSTLT